MTLTDTAYAHLRRDILSGDLAPGSPLRLETLRARYGMGFSPLREALNRLAAERLTVAAAQRGFTVAPISTPEMWDAIETRILIEGQALRLSMARGGDAWETGIVAARHALALAAARDPGAVLEDRHRDFHRALIAGCASPWLLDIAGQLYAQTERYRAPMLARGATAGRDLAAEHGALADAALARDPAAPDLLADHYRATGRALQSAYAAAAE
jgi:GntR family transcriptional regulator, carbon starvation induced regulator